MAEFNYFEELKTSLEEAVDYKRGDRRKARVSVRTVSMPEYKAEEIARLRTQLRLSQRALGAALGVSTRTVEAWEAGRNIPNGTARHLLYLMEKDNTLVDRLIIR